MMKIKVAFGNDLRLFKYDGASLLEAFDRLTTFVRQTFGVASFRLSYRDEENDLITIASEHELDEGLDLAMEQGRTLKVFVVADAAQQTNNVAVEEKAEVPPVEPQADAETETVGEDESVPLEEDPHDAGDVHNFAQLLVEDEGFRQEFAALAQDVVLQLREGDNFETAFRTALLSHEELESHRFVQNHLLPRLPFIAQHAEFAVPFLKSVEPTEIPGMVDRVAQGVQEGQHLMPCVMNMMGGGHPPAFGFPPMGPFGFGGMPFFGGGCGPHGESHGRGAGGPSFHPFGAHPFGGHRGRGHRGGHCRGRGRGRGRGFGCHRMFGGRGRCGKKGERQVDIVDSEVTVADRAVVLPKTSVVKTWRIRNNGDAAFPEGTTVKYVGRPFNLLVDGVEFPVDAVAAGEEAEISVLLSAPEQPGRYGSAWRLHTADGTPFGPMFRARLVVADENETKSSDSDDLADVYDGAAETKKEKKLRKLLAKRAKLEARLATLSTKIEETQRRVEENQTEEAEATDEATETRAAEQAAVVEAPDVFERELAELAGMGFENAELNRALLHEHNGEMQAVLNTLCEFRA